jgi:hypothetical protein
MKTQEEIEQLANEWSLINSDDTMETNSSLNKGYIAGYTQALEDNKEKKYTEEDMRAAMICVIVSNSIKNSKDITEYIVESLNKK